MVKPRARLRFARTARALRDTTYEIETLSTCEVLPGCAAPLYVSRQAIEPEVPRQVLVHDFLNHYALLEELAGGWVRRGGRVGRSDDGRL